MCWLWEITLHVWQNFFKIHSLIMKEGGSKMGSGCDIWAQHWLMSRESRAKVCSKYAFANLELNYQTKFSAWSQLESSRILMDLWVGCVYIYVFLLNWQTKWMPRRAYQLRFNKPLRDATLSPIPHAEMPSKIPSLHVIQPRDVNRYMVISIKEI